MSVYLSEVWPSNCFTIVRMYSLSSATEKEHKSAVHLGLQTVLSSLLTGYVNQVSHSSSCKSGIVINTQNERANYYWHVAVLCYSLFWEPNPTIWKNVA